jgi:PHP family Zn ribbon phosphoesterase
MGVVYKMSCERCGTTFDHQAGIGFYCSCPDCGEDSGETPPFYCPVCNKRFEPLAECFNQSLVDMIVWE